STAPPPPPPSPPPPTPTTRPAPAAVPPPTPSSPGLRPGSSARGGSHDRRQAPTDIDHEPRRRTDPHRRCGGGGGAGVDRGDAAVPAGRGRLLGHPGGDRVSGGGRPGVGGAVAVVAGPAGSGDAHRSVAGSGRGGP